MTASHRTMATALVVVSAIGCSSGEELSPETPGYTTDQIVLAPQPLRLWYDEPAAAWVEALPLGNGRLGAMVFGDPSMERIQLNEESLWAGIPVEDSNPEALEALPRIRQLLFENKNSEAVALAHENLLSTPPRVRSYQTLADLKLTFPDGEVRAYSRELDLETGIAKAEYIRDGVQFEQLAFISAVHDVIVVRLESQQSGALSVQAELSREAHASVQSAGDTELALTGQVVDEVGPEVGPPGEHMRFAAFLKAEVEGGVARSADGILTVENADAVTLLVSAATDYDLDSLDIDSGLDPLQTSRALVEAAKELAFDELQAQHQAEHTGLMDRVTLDVGAPPDDPAKPTDERLAAVQAGAPAPGLAPLYFQYGRYLLMGSSRAPGRLPANLQGIWNEHLQAPWGADYHTNINLQMNYWPAEVTNLSETALPLIDFVDRLRVPGRVTAQKMYGASGWTMHHNTDVFGRTGLHDGIEWGTFPMGGAWMTLPVWRHYEFSKDKDFLEAEAYPIMKESAQFVLDFLVEAPNGQLVTAPSYSPENTFVHPETGEPARLTYAATMDIQIATELFKNTIAAARALKKDKAFRQELQRAIERLPPVQVGGDGTIMEWIEDYEEAEPGHRHISHLFGLHPGTQITPDTPELFAAARATIEKRLEHGGAGTGWSRAWTINFFARLRDGDAAAEHLRALLEQSTLPNLFDDHPPFQIDGNFGGTAGIAEMLLQSHTGVIDLLPALPSEWPSGAVAGLKARGGFVVDIEWRDGALLRAELQATTDGNQRVRYKDKEVELSTRQGKFYLLNAELEPI